VIFYSGLSLPATLRERYPSASLYKKPTPPVQLLTELVALMRKQSADGVILAVGARPAHLGYACLRPL
jgi:hypothetical protein